MLRNSLLLLGLVAITTLSAGGCRSCASYHDYDPPVAGCDCDAYGTHRAGSASGGYVGGHVEEHYYDSNGEAPEPVNSVQARRVGPRR